MHARPRRRFWRRRFKRFSIYLEIMALVALAVMLGVVGGTVYSVSKILPSALDIASYEPTEATRIISSDGVTLAEVYEENREVVPINDIPKDLQNATIAVEDERFYRHCGVDFRGIARAFYENLRAGRITQGGSTLTQQLARNIYLTRERKLSRKLQEIVLALQLERNYSKEQILELYLNQIYYGSGAYGVQTASKTYFGKDVKDLTLGECALLAGLPQKPSSYSPYEDLDAAIRRRGVVLNRMVALGRITREQADEARDEEVKLVGLTPKGLRTYKAPWFVTYVVKLLSEEYGADLVYRGGLRVYTTLNYEMQQVAEDELRKRVAAARSRNVSQGALICIDPHTGYIKAMVGGVNPDFTKDQFNRAVQARRQPGSAFKAFVYTAAVDNGYDPDFLISNEQKTYTGYGSQPWTPRNYDGRYGGSKTMKQAVAQSVNVCAVRMAEKIGIDQVVTYARMLGIKSPLDPNLSLALGASGVTPLELCSAYGVFAADGVRAEPMAIVRITESNGRSIIEENKPVTYQVLSEQTVEIMNELFRAVVVGGGGTGYAARPVPNAHGKTGTTQDDRDAWFIGYTPELVTAVWVGNDDYSNHMRNVWGGNVCAPTWTAFMLKALRIHAREDRNGEQPSETPEDELLKEEEAGATTEPREEASPDRPGHRTRRICAESGLLAVAGCPRTYEVSDSTDAEPLKDCTMHAGRSGEAPEQPSSAPTPPPGREAAGPPRPGTSPPPRSEYVNATICVDSGHIANFYCPETISQRFRAGEAPKRVCSVHKPRTD